MTRQKRCQGRGQRAEGRVADGSFTCQVGTAGSNMGQGQAGEACELGV